MNDAVEQARLKALNHALKELRAGKDADAVLEAMSKALTAKLMHPIITKIKDVDIEFDIEQHRKTYDEAFKNGRQRNRSDS